MSTPKRLLVSSLIVLLTIASGCSRTTVPGKWMQKDTGVGDAFYTVNFVDENVGWINAQGDRTFKSLEEEEESLNANSNTSNGNRTAANANKKARKDGKEPPDPLKANQGFEVLQTTDGGETWRQLPDQFKHKIRSVWFVDQRNGWALTIDRDILHTADAGATWTLQRKAGKVKLKLFGNRSNPEMEQPEQIDRLYFHDANRGWAWGGGKVDRYTEQPGVLLVTLDGGSTWNQVTYPFGQNIYSIFFLDTERAWVSTEGEGFYRTTDGGLTWTRIEAKLPEDVFRAIFFLDSNNGWIVGRSGRLAKTVDGGRSWQKMYHINLEFEMRDVHFVDKDHGWAVGGKGAILYTPDGGENWLSLPAPVQADLLDLAFINQRVGWAVGLHGASVKYEATGGG